MVVPDYQMFSTAPILLRFRCLSCFFQLSNIKGTKYSGHIPFILDILRAHKRKAGNTEISVNI